jgi:hypothetical protein
MRVSFHKTGPRRYAVRVHREHASDLEMHPAPAYDDWLPHDLVHLVVERETGLRDGIFGQLAAGGDAHTFVPTDEPRTRRWARRTDRRNAATGAGIERSERLAAAATHQWKRRAGHYHVDVPPDPELAPTVDAVQPALDAAAETWHALPVGGALELEWPWPERRRRRTET